MAVLLFILRLIGWILLALLVILLAALVLPLGIRVSYHPGSLQVRAYYGPLQFTLWPRGGAGNAPAAPAGKPAATAGKPSAPPAAKAVAPQAPPEPAAAPQPGSADTAPPEPESTPPKGSLPFGISEHINAARQLLSDDPMAFASCMLDHTGWLGRLCLRTLRVTHLDIFWTVHADEAAATAALYGAEMALANNLLAFVQQHVRLQSDRLWLEPDFTGQRAGERSISFSLNSCAGVLLWLLLRLLRRLWKDPQLQPAHTS
ncbi:hypothetical protein [Gemmiger sp.]|uniref:hypothetical protein n=1 Tax=Gemmiger sp. TaxID=2049027 RepID=UPI003AB73301